MRVCWMKKRRMENYIYAIPIQAHMLIIILIVGWVKGGCKAVVTQDWGRVAS
jgi:hypothetical protein